MRTSISLGWIAVLVFCAAESAGEAATFAPFVRSRYSLRRKQATATPLRSDGEISTTGSVTQPALDATPATAKALTDVAVDSTMAAPSTTTASTSESMTASTANHNLPVESTASMVQSTTKAHVDKDIAYARSTTAHPKEKLHNLAEYDYYDSSEVEESEGRQT